MLRVWPLKAKEKKKRKEKEIIWGENVIVMYTCKDNLIPLLYSGKIKTKKSKKKKKEFQNVCSDSMRSVSSWEHWDTGSIPSPAQLNVE